MPRNDGSEVAELEELNASEIFILRKRVKKLEIQLNLAQGQSSDAYRQTGEALVLLGECRDLFETVMDTQLHEQIQALMKKIDTFKGGQ